MKRNGRHIIPGLKWTLHLSVTNVWDLGYGRGHVSTYLALKSLATQQIGVEFVTSADRDEDQQIRLREEGINVHYTKRRLDTINKRILWNLSAKILHLRYYAATKGIIGKLVNQYGIPPSLIIAHSWYNLLTTHCFSSMYCVPAIVRLYGVSATMPYWRFILKNPEYLLLSKLPSIDTWIVTDDGTNGDKFLNSLSVPHKKVRFWRNGVNFHKPVSKQGIAENKRLLGLHPSSTVFCTAARLVAWKGIHLIVDAFARFLSSNPETARTSVLLIIGDGADRERLKERVRDRSIEDCVHFLGAVPQKEVYTYLNICDIYVTANQLSAVANPTLEAMFLGKPVIALNTGNSAALIQNEVTGLLLPNSHPVEHLTKAMQHLAYNIEEREKLGKKARAYLKTNWLSWEERIQWELKEYQTLM